MFSFFKRKKEKKLNKWIEAHEKLDELFCEITYQDPPDFDIDAEIQKIHEGREKLKQEKKKK